MVTLHALCFYVISYEHLQVALLSMLFTELHSQHVVCADRQSMNHIFPGIKGLDAVLVKITAHRMCFSQHQILIILSIY